MMEVCQITEAAATARLLGNFKCFCDRLLKEPVYAQNILNILCRSTDPARTIKRIFQDRFDILIFSGEEERMLELVRAFFKKKTFRSPITPAIRQQLLAAQEDKCAFCGCEVGEHDPVDHIVPFKYVGDELKNNYQILCHNCNSHKNARIDYQIRFLLHLV